MGGSLREVLRRLRQAAEHDGLGEGLTDTELLRRWSASRDEAAFEVLVWRHGPIVLGLCRHWLSRTHDAEDAFQATFFTLARQAASIHRGQGLAAWLHRVAFRVCLRARNAVGQSSLQGDVLDRRASGGLAELSMRELRIILDEEVNRLPERYRVPFVLCCLAGHTNAEAAQLLCLPVGTIQSRLSTARQRLRSRLSRRGLAPAALAGVLALAESAQAGMSAVLVSSTVKAATLFAAGGAAAAACSAPVVALTEGVLQAMFTAKIKAVAAVVLSVVLLGTGGGVFGYRAFGPADAGAAEESGPDTAAKPANKADQLRKQMDALRVELAAMRDKLAFQEALLKERERQIAALSKPGTAEVVADQRDSLELLRAQFAVKKALLDAAKVDVDQATKRLKRLEELWLRGAVTEQAYRTAKSAESATLKQLAIREAELKESALRVQQAERRLKEKPAPKKGNPAAGPIKVEDRLFNLEKKLTELLKEVQAMRHSGVPQPK